MSVPRKTTRPEVGRVTPESRLNSVVFPAPLGPMITRNSPSVTSRFTSSTMTAPRMRRPRPTVDITGPRTVSVMGLLERTYRRRDRFERNRAKQPRLKRPGFPFELRDEHRLQHRVIRGTHRLPTLWCVECPTFERGDHLPDIVTIGFLDRMDDHFRRHEAVRRKDVWDLVLLLERRNENAIRFSLRSLIEVVGEEGELRAHRSEGVV